MANGELVQPRRNFSNYSLFAIRYSLFAIRNLYKCSSRGSHSEMAGK
jgi:hypothetical protein